MSGPDPSRGRIEVRRAGSGDDFEALPTDGRRGSCGAHWDSDSYPAGEYEFRATGYDAAGNSVTTGRRTNGTSMLLAKPIEGADRRTRRVRRQERWSGTAVRAQGGQRRCRRESDRGFSLRPATRLVPYGRRPRSAAADRGARLAAGRRMPGTDNRAIRLRAQPGAAGDHGARPTRTACSPPIWRPGPSRTVDGRFRRDADADPLPGRPVRLGVRGGVRMRCRRRSRRSAVGRSSSAAKSWQAERRFPRDGKSVQLQFRVPGIPWTEFRTIQTDPLGTSTTVQVHGR